MNRLTLSIQNRWRRYHRQSNIRSYVRNGQKPWAAGYGEYRERVILENLNNLGLIGCFRSNRTLPASYGYHLDERVVEFPWVLARLTAEKTWLLDAGSALNFHYLLNHDILKKKQIAVCALSPEEVIKQANISYVYGDLRRTLFREEWFDEIVCISTLEHIGMDNTFLYSGDARYHEKRPEDYLQAVKEFRRLLKPRGKLLLTVPYGSHADLGWLQVFDEAMIDKVLRAFGGSASEIAYYRYFPDGWQVSKADECTRCAYFDIHRQPDYDPDYAAAARAVACLELVK